MTDTTALLGELPADGPAAPPRSNGELVFAAPWEGRAFGLMVALTEQGVFTLSDFQAALINSIAQWDELERPVEEYHYYECWLAALETLVVERTPVTNLEIDALTTHYLTRPAGHDHDHDHDHDHHH
jgi:nitrile hydratase accessory protein